MFGNKNKDTKLSVVGEDYKEPVTKTNDYVFVMDIFFYDNTNNLSYSSNKTFSTEEEETPASWFGDFIEWYDTCGFDEMYFYGHSRGTDIFKKKDIKLVKVYKRLTE